MKGRSRLRVAGSVMGVAAGLAAFGIGSPAFASSSNFLKNLFYGGAPPPSAPDAPPEVDCPAVTIAEGGAALRSYTGGRTGSPEALRNQLSIVNVARECVGRRDGSIVVKVGVEGQALIGPAGSADSSTRPCASSSSAATGCSPTAPGARRWRFRRGRCTAASSSSRRGSSCRPTPATSTSRSLSAAPGPSSARADADPFPLTIIPPREEG